MPSFEVVKNKSEIPERTGWTEATNFKNKDRVVDSQGNSVTADYSGRKYQLISKKEHLFTFKERAGRICLGTMAVICSMFFALASKSVRNLFVKHSQTIRYAVLLSPSTLPKPDTQKERPKTRVAHKKQKPHCDSENEPHALEDDKDSTTQVIPKQPTLVPVPFTPEDLPKTSKEVEDWKTNFEDKLQKGRETNNTLKNILHTKPHLEENHKEETRLKNALADFETYITHQYDAISITNTALQLLLEGKSDAKTVAFARAVYKTGSAFLRKHTKPTMLSEYKKHLTERQFQYQYNTDANPRCYLFKSKQKVEWKTAENHAEYIHLLRQLRRRIKLITKQDKITAILRKDPAVKKLPKELFEKASKYLGLSWMHGTKASVIKSACEHTKQELIPTGELFKKKATPLTGEMGIGVTATGINRGNLSGVSLGAADEAVAYAHNFNFNLHNETEQYKFFINSSFSTLKDCLDRGAFARTLQALCRMQAAAPDQLDYQILKNKLEEIHKTIEKIFAEKPNEIFNWHDDYFTVKFYAFLKFVDALKDFLVTKSTLTITNEDIDLANLPLVVGTSTKVGTPAHLTLWEEPEEEVIPGHLKLGADIKVVFTENPSIKKVQQLLHRYGLDTSVAVESMDVLKASAQMERVLAPYTCDYYNQKKWEREIASRS